MNSRERVLCALNHEEPDRVPLFIGVSGVTTVLGPGYPGLKNYLGFHGETPMQWFMKPLQYARMEEAVMKRLGSDGRPVAPGPTISTLSKEISDDCLVDDYGCTWERRPGNVYFEMPNAPLQTATIDDLDRFPWPDLLAPSRFEGLADRCRAVQEAGYACVLQTGINLFEKACLLRGLENCLMDLVGNEDFYLALQARLKKMAIPYLEKLLQCVGPYADVVTTGDDLGTQNSLLMSPDVYRRLIKPHEAEVLAAIKANSKAKIFFHSCGNIYPLIGDLIDIGVDLLNPVQVSAPDMADTARLKTGVR